ncbi:MAG TPA: porin family protein [Thermoanaerobaculia bacterium]
MKHRVAILVLGAALTAAAASAQVREGTVEISPFAGYLFGGEFARGTTSLFNARVDVDDQATYGLRIGYNVTENFQMEAQASRTDTHFVSGSNELFGPGSNDLGDLRIDYLLGYGTFNFGHRRAVPYVTVGAGVARLDPDVPGRSTRRDTRFTASLGVGLKAFVNPHFGFRFDGRGYATLLPDRNSDRFGCDDFFSDCRNNGEWLTNGELSGGLILAF